MIWNRSQTIDYKTQTNLITFLGRHANNFNGLNYIEQKINANLKMKDEFYLEEKTCDLLAENQFKNFHH